MSSHLVLRTLWATTPIMKERGGACIDRPESSRPRMSRDIPVVELSHPVLRRQWRWDSSLWTKKNVHKILSFSTFSVSLPLPLSLFVFFFGALVIF